ncbi:MAG: phage portal protein, partial [Actinobacteria bacterium]|nr:phage portal protein [Actinomycetota bacterium]
MPRLWQQLAERRQINDPAKPLTDESLISVLNAGWSTDAGVTVTPETALRVTAVYRAVSLLAGVLGALPLHAYRRTDTGRQRLDNTLLDVPHPDKTPMEVWEYVFMSLLTHGNAYVRKLRDGVGRIVQLWPLHPGAIKVKQDDGWRTADNPVGKRFYLGEPGNNGDTTYWTPYEVMHVPGMSYNGLYGLSPLQQARQAIGLGVAAQQFGSRMFDRGGLIPGVLQTDMQLA